MAVFCELRMEKLNKYKLPGYSSLSHTELVEVCLSPEVMARHAHHEIVLSHSEPVEECYPGITAQQPHIRSKKIEIIEPDFIYTVHEI